MTAAVVDLGAADLDRIEPLWLAMAEHHRQVTGHRWSPRDPGESWRRRRAQYEGWLAGDGAAASWLLGAVRPGEDALLGYAVVLVQEGDGPTWDLGEEVGDLESLAVVPHARGGGVGTALIAAARDRLRARGVTHWTVSVIARNEPAIALYARSGFEPFFATMLGEV